MIFKIVHRFPLFHEKSQPACKKLMFCEQIG
nr:MAG TPA: hypothetical protein [Caudoviricetes sp.]DAP75761.1 MAG TPA: hypothetical protein [Caudoviricetes sp.]